MKIMRIALMACVALATAAVMADASYPADLASNVSASSEIASSPGDLQAVPAAEKVAGCCLCPNGQGGVEYCRPPLNKGNPPPALVEVPGQSSIPRRPQLAQRGPICPRDYMPYCRKPLNS